jgi:fibronectin type 3 domain-containing protein
LLGFAIFGLLAGPWSASIQSGLSPISNPGRVTDSSLTSWNPHVSCSADLVTIRDVLGPAYPSQTVNGSRYQTNSTAGGIPQERALAPPCTITNKTGTVVSSFVQINGVSLYGYGVKTTDCSGWYSKQNGGGRYPGNKTFCTNAGQIITIGTTRGYMKIEIDRDWLGKGYCGVGVPYCDNATLGNYQSNGSISLDIQGFVFWEGPWHWEIHPMTGWKLSAPPTPPSAPRNLAATGGNAQVTLNWQAPASDGGSPVTNYRIYRGAASGTKTLLTTVGAVLTYTDGAVTNGLTYYYQVSAVNGPGEGAKSNEASATPNPPPPPPSPPSAPTNLVATGGNAQVALTWQAPASNGGSQITNYRVYRGTTSGGKTLLATLGVVTSYTDTSVTNGVTYYYQVSAVNSVGEGPRSNEATATPSAPAAPPTAPQGLVATGGVGTVTLVWSPPSNNGGSPVTNYRIYRGTSSNGETLLTTIGNVLTYIDTAVTNGVTYYYQVSAVNSAGEGPRSNEASATPSAPPPPPNFGISASPVSLSIHIGSSGTSTITLTSLNGFAGTIGLSTSIACSGVCVVYPTASLNPTSVTLSAGGTGASTLTVSTSVLTTPGTYTVTITATSGSITHTVTVTVQVYV